MISGIFLVENSTYISSKIGILQCFKENSREFEWFLSELSHIEKPPLKNYLTGIFVSHILSFVLAERTFANIFANLKFVPTGRNYHIISTHRKSTGSGLKVNRADSLGGYQFLIHIMRSNFTFIVLILSVLLIWTSKS